MPTSAAILSDTFFLTCPRGEDESYHQPQERFRRQQAGEPVSFHLNYQKLTLKITEFLTKRLGKFSLTIRNQPYCGSALITVQTGNGSTRRRHLGKFRYFSPCKGGGGGRGEPWNKEFSQQAYSTSDDPGLTRANSCALFRHNL